MKWFAQVNIFDGLIPVLVGRMNLKPETVQPETGLIPVLVRRVNLKPETVKPEPGLIPVLVRCINLKPETLKPETVLVPVLVGRMNLKPETVKVASLHRGRTAGPPQSTLALPRSRRLTSVTVAAFQRAVCRGPDAHSSEGGAGYSLVG